LGKMCPKFIFRHPTSLEIGDDFLMVDCLNSVATPFGPKNDAQLGQHAAHNAFVFALVLYGNSSHLKGKPASMLRSSR
jgi:hypothetical protein